jgi:uncharacterized protein (TIGR02271 family)
MRQTVVGIFDQYAAAKHAADLLRQRGIDDDDIHVTATDDDADEPGERQEAGLFERIRNFFSGDVDNDFEVSAYSEHVRRGGAVLKVEVDDEPEVDVAREVLESAGAVDIDERVNEWKQGGWTGAAAADSASTSSASGSGTERTITAGTSDQRTASSTGGEQVIPVVQEEVQVGKRAVKAGGVRVYARVVEQPVHESVDLREERARVERRPVDRPASAADLKGLGERSIEVEETVERPVVQKTARVVEEVSVGKDVRHVQADIDETVRRTEVDVQQSGGDKLGRAYADFDDDFRSDFSTRYGASGKRYEDFEPAYRYGHTLASDSRYAGRSWDEFEADAQSDWSRSNSGSAWQDIKDAVRHAWERARGR